MCKNIIVMSCVRDVSRWGTSFLRASIVTLSLVLHNSRDGNKGRLWGGGTQKSSLLY